MDALIRIRASVGDSENACFDYYTAGGELSSSLVRFIFGPATVFFVDWREQRGKSENLSGDKRATHMSTANCAYSAATTACKIHSVHYLVNNQSKITRKKVNGNEPSHSKILSRFQNGFFSIKVIFVKKYFFGILV